jgi:hypothetical protein
MAQKVVDLGILDGYPVYDLVVSNIGLVRSTSVKQAALDLYNEYVSQSKLSTGRAAGENVTLMEDGEPIKEFWGDKEIDEYWQEQELLDIESRLE